MYKVKLTEFVNKMNLKSLLPDIDTDSIMIEQSAVNRLALQLAGFFEHFDSERIQVIGNVEAAYIKQIPEESITQLCEKIFSFNIPCLVFCRGLEPIPQMLDTAEKNGVPIGYAYASAFKGRAAYDWSVETSIYVSQNLRSSGVGSLLYQKLEKYLTAQHICNVCACITYPNPPSISFHEKLGYKTVAHFHASGFKQGEWHDMIWMEKTLCPHPVPPLPFIPFPEL